MAAVALAGFLDKNSMPPEGIVATAVLPGGCPFACSFCIVRRRGERAETSWLTPDHLSALLHSIASRRMLGAAAIVGDEPLQQAAWPYAAAFLQAASSHAVPTAMVTNGFELEDFVLRLLEYPKLRVLVSVDGVGSVHDRIRRTPGAFVRIERGLRLAAQHPTLRNNLTIATTLVPRNVDKLGNILQFVTALGIPRMVISPVLTVDPGKPISLPKHSLGAAAKRISQLVRDPKSQGVSLHFTDEFGLLGDWGDALREAGIDVIAPRRAPQLVRVDAGGRVETLNAIRDGRTTGLRFPYQASEMADFVDELLSVQFATPAVAA